MNVASMPKFIRLGDGRSHYRCRKCADRPAPVSDSAPLRVLDLYTLVRDGDSKPTLLRRAAYRLRLCAPPSRWAWGEDMGELPVLKQAMPQKSVCRGKGPFDYNQAESDAIWCYSSSYEGKAQ